MKQVTMYTDGSCLGNPGIGGFAAILSCNGVSRNITGAYQSTTNNRMELQGVIAGLSALKEPCSVTVYSDSKYVVDNIRSIAVWKKRGWKLSGSTKSVKNRDQWEELDSLCAKHSVSFVWVRGHDGNEGNEKADELANTAARELQQSLQQG